jgi:hypothetical protein
VEAIDAKAPSVTVKGPQGRVVPLAVRDATQLQNIKIGDTVDVTYYESLLVKVARPPNQRWEAKTTCRGGSRARAVAGPQHIIDVREVL